MIIHDFFDSGNLDVASVLREHESVRMCKIHRVLSLTVSMERVATTDAKHDQRFHRVQIFDLSDAQLEFQRHLFSVFPRCSFCIRADVLELVRPILDFHLNASFTFLVNIL